MEPPAGDVVIGLGAPLPQGDIVTVAPPYRSCDARLEEILVAEGDRVRRGDILATLENKAYLTAALKVAKADVAVSEAQLFLARADTLAQNDEAAAALRGAEAAAANARSEFDRAQSLNRRAVFSQAVLDERRADRDQADRAVEEARAQLSRYSDGALDAQRAVLVASRNLAAATARLDSARRELDQSEIRAPIDGAVIRIDGKPGENPTGDGVMTLGDIDTMTSQIEVHETEIRRISLGAPVEIKAAALPRELQGVVTRIGLEVRKQERIDDDPAANTDARVVEVWATLDGESSRIASQYANLQVFADQRRRSDRL